MITQVYVTIYVYGYLIRLDAVHTTGHSAYHHICAFFASFLRTHNMGMYKRNTAVGDLFQRVK